jgi:hypothetical protein
LDKKTKARIILRQLIRESESKLRPYDPREFKPRPYDPLPSICPPDIVIFKCWICDKYRPIAHLRWASAPDVPRQVEICDICLETLEDGVRRANEPKPSILERKERAREMNRLRVARWRSRQKQKKKV